VLIIKPLTNDGKHEAIQVAASGISIPLDTIRKKKDARQRQKAHTHIQRNIAFCEHIAFPRVSAVDGGEGGGGGVSAEMTLALSTLIELTKSVGKFPVCDEIVNIKRDLQKRLVEIKRDLQKRPVEICW